MGEKNKSISKNDVHQDIKELKQLHDLTSIETILVTIWVATLVLGITLFVTVDDPWWKIASLFIIMFTITPVCIFFGSFFSTINLRVISLQAILFTMSLYLIALAVMVATIKLLTINYFTAALTILGITNFIPLFILTIFEFWGIFIYFWYSRFEPNLNNRFNLLLPEKKSKIKSLVVLGKLIKKLFLPFIVILLAGFVVYCIRIGEFSQSIIIIIIGILDILFIIQKIKKKRKKVCSK